MVMINPASDPHLFATETTTILEIILIPWSMN